MLERIHLLRRGPGPNVGITDLAVGPDDVTLTGWAEHAGRPLGTVIIEAGARPVAVGKTGLPTPDSAVSDGYASGECSGWTAVVPRTHLGVGAHALTARTLLPFRRFELAGPVQVEVLSPAQLGFIDVPAAEAEIDGSVVTVRGWFRATHGYDRVDLFVNDVYQTRARILANPRPDLRQAVHDVDAGICGFEAWLELASFEGEVCLSAVAVAPGRRILVGERRFTLTGRPGAPDLDEATLTRTGTLARRVSQSLAPSAAASGGQTEVLVATHHLGIGGGQLWLHELMLRLMESPGIRFRVLSSDDGPLRDQLEELGVEVQVVGYPPLTGPGYEQWLRGIAGVINDRPAHAVLVNTAGAFWGVDVAERLQVPSVWAIHESFSPELFMNVGLAPHTDAHVRARFMKAFETAAAVVFEADSTREIFESVVRPGRGVRVDYGVDLQAVASARDTADADRARRSARISPRSTVLLCVGTYEPRKAQALLTLAFSRLAKDYPHAVLALVGYNGTPYADEVVELVRKLDLEKKVICVPTTPEIYDWYALADAFVLASDVESLPRSMIEAMAFGLPVIGTNVFGVGELVEDASTGILFEPSSIADAEQALRRFLDLSESEQRQMGDRAQEVALKTRSSERYAVTFRALIDALVVDASTLPSDVIADGSAAETVRASPSPAGRRG